jgi:hypothetical protein
LQASQVKDQLGAARLQLAARQIIEIVEIVKTVEVVNGKQ